MVCQSTGAQWQGSPVKCRGSLLAVLLSLAEFGIGQVPFGTDVTHHGSITIIALIGSGHAFLKGFGVIERRDIKIKRYVTVTRAVGSTPIVLNMVTFALRISFRSDLSITSIRWRSVSADGIA